METKFNSQICTTREQSERLIALGLKKETADMGIYYSEFYGVDRVFTNDVFDEKPTFDSDEIPAWSLHRLIVLCKYNDDLGTIVLREKAYDYMIESIEFRIKEGYFNKEYLKNERTQKKHEVFYRKKHRRN